MNNKEEQVKLDDVLFREDEKLEKELLGTNYPKQDLLNNTETFEIEGLGMNRFGKLMLVVKDKKDNHYRLSISKKNKNQLIDMLGNSLKDWVGNEVKVTGKAWKGTIDEREVDGVELFFAEA